jgi:xylulokinase
MTEKFILAHDLGTTGNKASLFDEQGMLRASFLSTYGTEYPQPNWVEQNPEDWWEAVCTSTRQLLTASGINPKQIACIAFSGQMMGCVVLDRKARPLRNALIWADTRAVPQAEKLISKIGMEKIYRITGHRASSSYSAAKIMWVRDHQPEIYNQAYKFVHAKDFIVARLTGKFATDYSDAGGTNLYDLEAYDWSSTMLEAVGLDRSVLPDLHESTDVIGEILPSIADEIGLVAGTPVVIGGGDGCCAAAGAGVVSEGSAYNYLGSSSWIAIATRQPIYDPAMQTFTWAHLVRGMFSPNGTMQTAGGAYQWLCDTFCQQEKEAADRQKVSPYELMDELAEQSITGANGLLFLPYLLGERSPRWNPDARAVYFGLTMGHTRADIIRATLEGIILNLKVILESFRQQGAQINSIRVIGGGAKARIMRQIMADIYGVPVQRPALLAEATSLGAALAGGIGVGVYKDWSVAETLTPIMDEIQPDPQRTAYYEKIYGIFNRAYEAILPLYTEIASLKYPDSIS